MLTYIAGISITARYRLPEYKQIFTVPWYKRECACTVDVRRVYSVHTASKATDESVKNEKGIALLNSNAWGNGEKTKKKKEKVVRATLLPTTVAPSFSFILVFSTASCPS